MHGKNWLVGPAIALVIAVVPVLIRASNHGGAAGPARPQAAQDPSEPPAAACPSGALLDGTICTPVPASLRAPSTAPHEAQSLLAQPVNQPVNQPANETAAAVPTEAVP